MTCIAYYPLYHQTQRVFQMIMDSTKYAKHLVYLVLEKMHFLKVALKFNMQLTLEIDSTSKCIITWLSLCKSVKWHYLACVPMEWVSPLSILALSRLDMACMVHFLRCAWVWVSFVSGLEESTDFSSSPSVRSFRRFMNSVKYLIKTTM